MRKRTPGAPIDGVDVVLADLDGVVYAGEHAIDHAVESLNSVGQGIRVGYITNNASRTDVSVAQHLTGLGLSVEPRDVVTSPQAAVRLLAGLVDPGSTVFVVGGDGLVSELEQAGFVVTRSADDRPAAVVQGFAPDVGWRDLAEASFALADDNVHWVATNTDWTLPQARGIAPGNGTLVSAVHSAVGRLPVVAGKPETPIFDEAVARFDARSPLFIGDRLDTDILGANRAKIRSVLVLTGIDRAKQLLSAKDGERPTYVVADLRELSQPYPDVKTTRGGTAATVRDAVVRLSGDSVEIVERGDDPTDLLRAACAVIWGSGRPIYSLDVPEELYA